MTRQEVYRQTHHPHSDTMLFDSLKELVLIVPAAMSVQTRKKRKKARKQAAQSRARNRR
jgi:hypothetical protein